jgi:hypothetical protein
MARGALPKRLGLTALQIQFVEGFCGDPAKTAARLGISTSTAMNWQRTPWFAEAIAARTTREVSKARTERVEQLAEAIADRTSIQLFWSQAMTNDEHSMRDRLAASKHLADSLGMFIQKIEHSGDPDKPLGFKCVDLEDRIKLLATPVQVNVTHEWLDA